MTTRIGVAFGSAAAGLGIAAAMFLFMATDSASAFAATLVVDPASQTASAPGVNYTVTLKQNADVATQGVQTDFTFNQTIMEIVSVALGSGYTGGALLAGSGDVAPAITSANSTGTLQDLATFLQPPASVPAGIANAFVITMRGKICGKSPLTLTNIEMLEAGTGANVPTTVTNGTATSGNAVDDNPLPSGNGVQDFNTPLGDGDCDGYPGALEVANFSSEAYLGTEPSLRCAVDSTANNEGGLDRWPVDFDDNRIVNLSDVLKLSPVFGIIGLSPAQTRFDLHSQDDRINLSDVLKMSPVYGLSCR